MDWIRNNKFLAGFFGFLLVGSGVLGYLLYTSYDHYTQVDQDYHTQVTELDRLHNLKPYPDEKGLKKFSELRRSYSGDVNTLQAKLAAYEPPPENPPLTPIQFADKLRKVVEDVAASAQSAGTALPEGFYMGFDQYRGVPPDAVATPLLSRELDEVNNLVGLLLKLRVDKINSIKRAPLPTEPGGGGSTASNARSGNRAGTELVVRYPVEIAFSAQPSVFREALNQITSANRLYIIRAVEVKNQVNTGPPREDISAAPPGGFGRPGDPPTAPAPGGVDAHGVPVQPLPTPGAPPLRYIVGLEKLDADLRIELVKVEPPTAALR